MNSINDFGRDFIPVYLQTVKWQIVALSPVFLTFFGYLALQFVRKFPDRQETPHVLIMDRIFVRSLPLLYGVPILVGSWVAVTVYEHRYCESVAADMIVFSGISLAVAAKTLWSSGK